MPSEGNVAHGHAIAFRLNLKFPVRGDRWMAAIKSSPVRFFGDLASFR